MSGSRPSAGKRNLQQQKREKAQAKVARKAARREAADADTTLVPVDATEGELIDQLANLHRAAEAGEVTAQEFEERREHIRKQLEQIEGQE